MRSLLAASVLVLALVCSSALAAATPKLPAPVTLRGVAGVVPMLSLREVREQWGLRMPAIEDAGSSTQYTHGVICADRWLDRRTVSTTNCGRWSSTVQRPPKNVGVGSSLRELRVAYRKRLPLVPSEDAAYKTAYRVYPGEGPVRWRPVIQFNMNKGRVYALLYGFIDPLRGLGDELDAVHC